MPSTKVITKRILVTGLDQPKVRGDFGLDALKNMMRFAEQAGQQKDIWLHRVNNGGALNFQGRSVRLPRGTPLNIRHNIITGGYEPAKRELIKNYMRPNLPVIELGASLGLVGLFISEHLDIEVDHLIVEADPEMLDVCRANATTERRASKTHVLQTKISYDGQGRDRTTLSDLLARVDDHNGYTLVCDIGGVELDMFEQDAEALEKCKLAIVEVHPDFFEKHDLTVRDFVDVVRERGFRQIDHIENVFAFARM